MRSINTIKNIFVLLAVLLFAGVAAHTIASPPEVRDETSDWQTYRNEQYGFEMKRPSHWKLCSLYAEKIENEGIKELFKIVDTKGLCTPNENNPNSWISVFVINQYASLSEFKEVLERAKLSIDKLFYIPKKTSALFEVGTVKESTFNGMSALQVDEISPGGFDSSTGVYIFHDQKLLRIIYSFDPSFAREGKKILSTFKLFPLENKSETSSGESKETIEYTTPGGISPSILRVLQWVIALLFVGVFLFKLRPNIFKIVFAAIFAIIPSILFGNCFIVDAPLPKICEYPFLLLSVLPAYVLEELGEQLISSRNLDSLLMPIIIPFFSFLFWYIIGSALFALYNKSRRFFAKKEV